TYLGKIKMIYIDPPYNTGKDFVYEDDFKQSVEEYMENSGQYDEEGNRLEKNLESNGRFHTDWLNMMYPRLKLARNLLSDDGVIFISIDDNEQENLKKICDEIFGMGNFVTQFVWEKKKKPSFLNKNIGTKFEYIVVYSKDRNNSYAFSVNITTKGKKYPFNNAGNGLSLLKFPPKSVKFINMRDGIVKKQNMSEKNIKTILINDFEIKDGTNTQEFVLNGEWRYNQSSLNQFIKENKKITISKIPFRPNLLKEGGEIKKMHNLLTTYFYNTPTNEDATEEIINLLGGDYFEYVKPVGLISFITKSYTYNNKDAIILDFFSGSATTAHATMQLNAEDGGNRKFILVQLPENLDESLKKASDNAKKTIENAIKFLDSINRPHLLTEIGKERIRRAGKKILEENKDKEGIENLDTGFRVLKVDSSNMKDVYYAPQELNKKNIFSYVDNIKEGRSSMDLLFQVMLDLGISLSSKIEEKDISGKKVFTVDGNFLIACFDSDIDDEVINNIAEKKPIFAVFKNKSFTKDSPLANLEEIFKTVSPDTVRKIL
uniref:site-specific DNA-methyltransferase n=1 Tax=Dialister micraerophilus TaxID=309120 RepID=UPI0023EF609B